MQQNTITLISKSIIEIFSNTGNLKNSIPEGIIIKIIEILFSLLPVATIRNHSFTKLRYRDDTGS